MTLVEQVGESLLALSGSDQQAFISIETVDNELAGRLSDTERLSKKWFDSHRVSFELRRNPSGGLWDWSVRLVGAACGRATSRIHQRKLDLQRSRELSIAEHVLPKLSADNLPRTLRSPELAGLLCVLSRGKSPHRSSDDLASALLRRLCRKGDATLKELLHEASPFPPVHLMRANVALEREKRQGWEKADLDTVLQAAAVDLHLVDDRPRAALGTAAVALWAAARRPFDERLNSTKCLLVPSAALRLQVELVEQVALSPHSSLFRPFGQMCAWLAHIVVTANLPPGTRGEVMQAFNKLTSSCDVVGRDAASAPIDAVGLCRLAMAIALIVREENNGFGIRAMESLARICSQYAMNNASDWEPQQLAVLASAFAAAEVPQEDLFRKIAQAGERHGSLGTEWSAEQLLKLMNSAYQLGHLKSLERLLKSLDQVLSRAVREANSRDVPMLFGAPSLMNDARSLEDLARAHRDKLNGISFSGLLSILKAWPQNRVGAVLAVSKNKVAREAISLAARKAPSSVDLKALAAVA